MTERDKKTKKNFFSSFIKCSLILSLLDKFTLKIYTALQNGFFGYIFTSYDSSQVNIFKLKKKDPKRISHFRELRYGLCRRMESAMIPNLIKQLASFLLSCRTKMYGIFLISFGIYTLLTSFVIYLRNNSFPSFFDDMNVLASVVIIVSSIPLILSKRTFGDALKNSYIGKLILKITNFSFEEIPKEKVSDKASIAFATGIVCGVLTYKISLFKILLCVAALVWAYLVIIKPEIGVMTLFFAMPMLPTMLLASIVIYTSFSYALKLFRGKRIFKFEAPDAMALVFSFLVLCGGLFSLSSASIKPSLLMVCLIMSYFLTVGLITSREWLVRCSSAAVISGVLISLYGLAIYFTGGGYSSKAWLDSEMFSSIGRRAVATLENPNMLGEYLILIIPIALGMLFGRGEGMRRISAFFSLGVLGVCLILTWSRGAWLGLIFGVLLFLLMWNRRSIWIIFAGIASLPLMMTVLPSSIVSRFTSIGNMADSSTSYRVHIWRATVNMIYDNAFSGIGVGEGAWNKLYPLYAFQGVETAPHSHNLYLQIWLEIGIVGLLAFLVFIFLIYQSGFSLFSKLSDSAFITSLDIAPPVQLDSDKVSGADRNKEIKRAKNQLRISTAAPLCGLFAVLVQGMTDYSWYNYRLFLMFWLVCGLAVSYARNGLNMINDRQAFECIGTSCDAEIEISNKEGKTKKKYNGVSQNE